MADGHQCPAPGCTLRVPSDQFACRRHWFTIPKPLRDKIWMAYRREPLGDRHLAAMAAAEDYLHGREPDSKAGNGG